MLLTGAPAVMPMAKCALPTLFPPEVFGKLIEAEIARWRPVVQKAGLSLNPRDAGVQGMYCPPLTSTVWPVM